MNTCEGDAPVPVEPSPKFQAYVSASPSRSGDPAPLNASARFTSPLYGPPAFATGVRFSVDCWTVIVAVAVLEAPRVSVATSVMENVPAAEYACDGDAPVALRPSPKLHE